MSKVFDFYNSHQHLNVIMEFASSALLTIDKVDIGIYV